MPVAQRKAHVVWEGNLTEGRGHVKLGSGGLPEFPVSWNARTVSSDGMTSPEELLAAADASCFSMQFSSLLNKAGAPPQRLDVTATCTLDRVDGVLKVTTMEIDVTGRADGLDESEFVRLAKEAGQGCPISGALRNSVEISVNALLEK